MIYRFSGLELDTDCQELTSGGTLVALPPKAFSVLSYLIENRDRMVTKVELLDRFWALQVSEAALQTTISLIRKALSEHVDSSTCVKTYHGRGFRFVALIDTPEAIPESEPKQSNQTPSKLGELRWSSVLAVRVKTDKGAQDSDQWQSQLRAFVSGAEAQVKASRGQLLHMMLDGFSASFGLDPHLEDGTRLAVSCAHKIVGLKEVVAIQQNGSSVSVGIDAGAATFSSNDLDSVWRLPSGVERHSAELANLGNDGDILLTKTVKDLLRDEIDTEPFGEEFRLIHPPEERAGLPARPLKRPTTFVGRGAEISFLNTSLERSKGDGCQVVVLSGPAGIGKSRLVSEFLANLDSNNVSSHRYYCLPRLSETPLALIRTMCLDLLDPNEETVALDPIETALKNALFNEQDRPDPILEGMSDRKRFQRSQALVSRLIAEVCANQTRVLVFEDVHWIDMTSRKYLEVLIRDVSTTNLMIVLTTRPRDHSSLAESVLQLAPLGRTDSLKLLREIPELAEVNAGIVETLVRRAGGNPFFLEELALATQTGADPARDLPDTVQAVIEVRIGEMDDALRMVIYIVAVIAQPATPMLIAHLLGQNEPEIHKSLERLVKQGFLQEAEPGYVFRHMLLHDTAYAMLAADDRRLLHTKIATYLEENTDAGPTRPETLAWHFQEAGQRQQAIGYWTKASYAALSRSAQQEATAFSKRGLSLIEGHEGEEPELEIRLQLPLAQSLMAMKGYGAKDVGTAFRRVETLSKKTENLKSLASATVGLWVHTWVRGQLSEALDHANNLLKMAKVSGDPSLLIQAHGGIGEVLTHMGDLTQAMTHLAAGMAVVGNGFPDTITAQSAAVTCASYATWVSAMQGRPDDLKMYFEQAQTLTQVFENRFANAIQLGLCSEAFMCIGDADTCLDLATQAVEFCREHDFPFWLGTGLVMQGWALGETGDTNAGLAAIDEGIVVFERTGAGVQLANWYGLKAETLMRAGRLGDARKSADHAITCAERTGDIWFLPRVFSVLAHIGRTEGDTKSAEALTSKVLVLAEREALAAPFFTIAG